jgi:nucleoid-associated protein YgaU
MEPANPEGSNLDVHADPQAGTVALAGQAASAEAMLKAVGMAGKVYGVSQVAIVQLPHPKDQEQGKSARSQQGDTLATIAQHRSGNANHYPWIFAANRAVMRGVTLRFPGQKIRMPPA